MKKWYRVLSLLVILMFAGLAASGCGSDSKEEGKTAEQAKTKEPYKVGLITTLSGPLASLGADCRDGAQLEVDRINAAGGINGHPLELLIEDDGGDPGKAVSAITKLARQDKALAVLGVNFDFMEAALRPVAEREKVPMLPSRPTVPEMRARHDKYTFNLAPDEFIRISSWLEMLADKGWTRVVGISQNDTLCQISLDLLKKEGAKHGVSVEILPEFINVDAVDVTPQAVKLKDLIAKTNAQVIVSTVWPPNLPSLLKALDQVGVEIPMIEFDGAADPVLFAMGGAELNGLILNGAKILAGEALPDSDPQKSVILDFGKRFEAKYKRPIGNIAASSFDGVNIVANALKESGADREKLREAIEKTKNYVGATGTFNYSPDNHEGLSIDCQAYYEIKDLKYVYQKSLSGKFKVEK